MGNNKKRILFLINSTDYAGTEKILFHWMQQVDFESAEITLVSSTDCFPIYIKNEISKVIFNNYEFGKLYSIIDWWQFFSKYKAQSVIFIETYFNSFDYLSVFCAWLFTRGNVYMTEHSDIKAPPTKKKRIFGIISGIGLWKYLFTVRALLSRRVLTVSMGMKDKLKNYFKYPDSKIEVFKSPIEIDRFSPREDSLFKIRRNMGISISDKVIINVSRLVKEKAVDKTISAFASLLKTTKRDDIWLWIVGDGYMHKLLKELVNNEGVSERVIFFGYQQNVEDYLKESDIFILSSDIEAFGIALLEAMSVGLVCIATSTCGAKELLQDKEFLVDHSVESLKNALNRAINLETEQLIAIKRNARHFIVDRFNSKKEVDRVLQLLNIPAINKM